MTASGSVRGSCCSICLDPFYGPSACIPCGHVFCEICIEQWHSLPIGTRSLCPQCRTFITSIQLLRIENGNIPIHHYGLKDRLKSFFHQQYLYLSHCTAEFIAQVPTNEQEMDMAAARIGIQNLSQRAHQVRHLPRTLKETWRNLESHIKFTVFLLATILLLFIIQDLSSPFGVFHNIILPILYLLRNILRDVLCCFLLLLCRPLVCIGQCVLEVVFALLDMTVGLTTLFWSIMQSCILVPCIMLNAVYDWMCLLALYVSEMFIGLIRLILIGCLVCLPVFFSQTTEEQRNVYFRMFLHYLQHVNNRVRNGLAGRNRSLDNLPGNNLPGNNLPGNNLSGNNLPGNNNSEL